MSCASSPAMEISVWVLNGILMVGTCAPCRCGFGDKGLITIGAIALVMGLVIRINNMAGWVMFVVTSIFENIGTVQEGLETISKPHADYRQTECEASQGDGRGAISYEAVQFHYGKETGAIDDLVAAPSSQERKVGLVGRSGAGKSTLVNLLLRFYDLERGPYLH